MIWELAIWSALFIAAWYAPPWLYRNAPTGQGMGFAQYAAITYTRRALIVLVLLALMVRGCVGVF